jgi:hypothetical protein
MQINKTTFGRARSGAGSVRFALAAIVLAGQAVAGDLPGKITKPVCEGPDVGEVTTVVTVPANESVNVFHYRGGAVPSVIEFCVRETGREWTLVASHGTDQSKWSLLQSWIYPKIVQKKASAYANGTLHPINSQIRTKTLYGYSFSWSDSDPSNQNDEIVYCYNGTTGCPASRRIDFP